MLRGEKEGGGGLLQRAQVAVTPLAIWLKAPREKTGAGNVRLNGIASIRAIATRICTNFLMVSDVMLSIECLSLRTECFFPFLLS